MRKADIGEAVAALAAVAITHPRPVTEADLWDIIGQAYDGEPPRF
jgi:hypothetical protein